METPSIRLPDATEIENMSRHCRMPSLELHFIPRIQKKRKNEAVTTVDVKSYSPSIAGPSSPQVHHRAPRPQRPVVSRRSAYICIAPATLFRLTCQLDSSSDLSLWKCFVKDIQDSVARESCFASYNNFTQYQFRPWFPAWMTCSPSLLCFYTLSTFANIAQAYR